MNILPKKRWHVRTKENIARVRKDEAEAAEIEKEIERRAKLAEQESRTTLLRKRAQESKSSVSTNSSEEKIPDIEKYDSKTEADIYTASGNINFFKDIEAGLQKSGVNKEHEEEKKAEQEGYEKKIGLLTYLGQDTLESTGKTAWYAEEKSYLSKLNKSIAASENDETEVGLKNKVQIDPLKAILKHTDTKVYANQTVTSELKNNVCVDQQIKPLRKSKNLCRKDKKHKKKRHKHKIDSKTKKNKKRKRSESPERTFHKKRKRYSYSSSDSSEEKNKHDKLAKLREERLKREAIEKKRQERLLAGKDPDVEEKKPESTSFKQKYNTQFNPHLAKQNQELGLTQSSGLQSGVKYWLQ